MLTNKEKKYLRKLANPLNSIFQVGKEGISLNQIKGVNDYLEAHELVKISVLKNWQNILHCHFLSALLPHFLQEEVWIFMRLQQYLLLLLRHGFSPLYGLFFMYLWEFRLTSFPFLRIYAGNRHLASISYSLPLISSGR